MIGKQKEREAAQEIIRLAGGLGEKEQPVFIAEAFKMKILPASLHVNEQIIIPGLEIMGIGVMDINYL